MKVSELIEKLKACQQDARVAVGLLTNRRYADDNP